MSVADVGEKLLLLSSCKLHVELCDTAIRYQQPPVAGRFSEGIRLGTVQTYKCFGQHKSLVSLSVCSWYWAWEQALRFLDSDALLCAHAIPYQSQTRSRPRTKGHLLVGKVVDVLLA